MTRVLHVAQPVEGGLGAYVADVARDQQRRGWDVTVACPDEGTLPDRLRADGVPHLTWHSARTPGPSVLPELLRLTRLVRRVRPDVVHLHSSKAGLVGRLALRGRTPTLFEPHGWSWLAVRGPVADASLRWERLSARWTSAIVCVSDGEAQVGRAADVDGRLVVVRNGVDVSRFAVGPGQHEAARRALGWDPDVPVAVSVGRLSEQKGHERLLQAWPAVRERVPGARLVVLGDGPLCQALADRRVDGVTLAGAGPVQAPLAAADLFVLASRWEGLSLALLEALAAGLPVVTTSVAGSEVVHPTTGAVLDADPLDDDAVVQALVPAVVARLGDLTRAREEGHCAALLARTELDQSVTHDRLAALTLDALNPVPVPRPAPAAESAPSLPLEQRRRD